jgi:hypothetical protein
MENIPSTMLWKRSMHRPMPLSPLPLVLHLRFTYYLLPNLENISMLWKRSMHGPMAPSPLVLHLRFTYYLLPNLENISDIETILGRGSRADTCNSVGMTVQLCMHSVLLVSFAQHYTLSCS